MAHQLNIHAVDEIVVQHRRLAEPGEPHFPKGLISTHITVMSTDGPVKIVCFGTDSAKKILVTTLQSEE